MSAVVKKTQALETAAINVRRCQETFSLETEQNYFFTFTLVMFIVSYIK